ncbi:uncharacterized protein LOC105233177 isoform X6 [Bactrocera dorsalis]|uniref:Uncharacterized protein LOC105233177 isoform X6 n=1 Tax=Bactrocera dorsalis TaxID=27457 RepID=A0ABM3J9E7_BACDO|nr:uncharacterized protein LOC105233177 isoform X6 [Bactrocera dorsalis]
MDFIKFLAVFVCIISHNNCDARVQMNQHSAEGNDLIDEIDEEKKSLLMIPKSHTLVVRLPLNTLLKYTAYKDISILHFKVPADTRAAFFAFKAYEEGKSVFRGKCKPQNVDIHLKAGSYPVISPETIAFPKNFLSADQRSKTYSLQFQSNEKQQHFLIEGPQIGDWYAVAFISWTDPNKDRIVQQGFKMDVDMPTTPTVRSATNGPRIGPTPSPRSTNATVSTAASGSGSRAAPSTTSLCCTNQASSKSAAASPRYWTQQRSGHTPATAKIARLNIRLGGPGWLNEIKPIDMIFIFSIFNKIGHIQYMNYVERNIEPS